MKLPDNPPWWDLFGTELNEIKRVCNVILSLYHQEPVRWLEPLHPNTLVSKDVLEKLEGGNIKKASEGEEGKAKEETVVDLTGNGSAAAAAAKEKKEDARDQGTPIASSSKGERKDENGLEAGTPMSVLSGPTEEKEGSGQKRKESGKGGSPRTSRGGRSRSLSRSRSRDRK